MNNRNSGWAFLCLALIACLQPAFGQRPSKKIQAPQQENEATTRLDGLKFRSIGPAFMSGRIADIALHPANPSIWYIAVGSGGVWKTVNAGTTWTPVFDQQSSYSIGCITLDPTNPEVVWVGTGENVGGRHVGYGDGIYRSADGGKSWEHRGLRASEHISKILIHPHNPDIIWVAAQGPLWSKGGERGVYKSTDGGLTWTRTLGDDAWVGATDLLIDPRHPERLYAATWQRHRTVAGYMGGGPGTALYRSEDGGATWQRLEKGLPSSHMGKIGLALSPQQPDVVYAAIELDRRKGGIFRSSDRGASWTKMSDEVSGGTGPHYYQELYACPHQFDRLYLVSNYMVRSEDGGKTFHRVNVNNKHVDDHAIAFRPDDPNYLLVGCDGGLYESFDLTQTWKYVANLPVTQFYKIALDDATPFYNVYGGTQDNNTQGGPSRTDNRHGIQNSDWFVVLGGDGHQPATEPGNPDIVYAQWQQGNLNRHDRRTGENVYIQPMAAPDEPAERWNWDAPIIVSPHDPAHLYFASQRVWKSIDRGDTWTTISGDLTTQTERITTRYYDEIQSWDNAWDLYAMSNYSTITSLGVSPVQRGLIYAGTDDGLIQVTENEGKDWRTIAVGQLPGLPSTAFVNDIKADLHDAGTVYAVFDNHKYGDYTPYLYKSSDKGRTWTRITATLPDRTLLWRIVQDHIKPELLFLGTEFGVYVSPDAGSSWLPLKGGLPPIPVRDLAIHRREDDLVLGTFGRGTYILDDYSALRHLSDHDQALEAILYPPRDAWSYRPKSPLGNWGVSQGDQHFMAPNPPYGVEFSYRLRDDYKSLKSLRQASEKALLEQGKPLEMPSWDALDAEILQEEPRVWLHIQNQDGDVLRRLPAATTSGYHRLAWDLRIGSQTPILQEQDLQRKSGSFEAGPGEYTAQLFKEQNEQHLPISEKVRFRVQSLREGSLKGADQKELAIYQSEVQALQNRYQLIDHRYDEMVQRVKRMREAYLRSLMSDNAIEMALHNLQRQLQDFDLRWYGSEARSEVGEKEPHHKPSAYVYRAYSGSTNLSYGPTPTQRQMAVYADKLIQQMEDNIQSLQRELQSLEGQLQKARAPAWDAR
jgi:photosystem II stability/assembly factor-like uncharacterized protein